MIVLDTIILTLFVVVMIGSFGSMKTQGNVDRLAPTELAWIIQNRWHTVQGIYISVLLVLLVVRSITFLLILL